MKLGSIGMKKGVIVTGDREIDAAFAQLEPKIQRKVARGAMRAGANRIAADALDRIRTSPSIEKGDLIRAIKTRAMSRSRSRIGAVILTKGAAHANIVEYGAKHMPAEPFLRPAGYGNKEYIHSMLIADIQDSIANPAWQFKKQAAMAVTAARREARKVITTRKRAKRKAAKKRAAK